MQFSGQYKVNLSILQIGLPTRAFSKAYLHVFFFGGGGGDSTSPLLIALSKNGNLQDKARPQHQAPFSFFGRQHIVQRPKKGLVCLTSFI